MSDIAIRAEGLSKRYRIGQLRGGYDTLREEIARLGGRVFGGQRRVEDRYFWALSDVSFEVERGTVIGIVGRNGAGKTTLLRVLSRVTDPTSGFADIRGRLGSLLEVGTGFHPELTGRENIYLNGAILGMRRAEIARRYDEIVEFSGVQRFIATPVKRYSSGMYMRLAFAVAAHLDTDILIVDEVLSVGDAEFQKRCLGKMHEVTGEGRTVVFVSHNMGALRTLCDRAVLLVDGRVEQTGDVESVIGQYLSAGAAAGSDGGIPNANGRLGSGAVRLSRARLLEGSGARTRELRLGQPFTLVASLDVHETVGDAVVEVGVSTIDAVRLATVFSTDGGDSPYRLELGSYDLNVELSPVLLPGQYSLDVAIHHASGGWMIDSVERVLDFEVVNVGHDAAEGLHRIYPYETVRGFVRPPARTQLSRRRE